MTIAFKRVDVFPCLSTILVWPETAFQIYFNTTNASRAPFEHLSIGKMQTACNSQYVFIYINIQNGKQMQIFWNIIVGALHGGNWYTQCTTIYRYCLKKHRSRVKRLSYVDVRPHAMEGNTARFVRILASSIFKKTHKRHPSKAVTQLHVNIK